MNALPLALVAVLLLAGCAAPAPPSTTPDDPSSTAVTSNAPTTDGPPTTSSAPPAEAMFLLVYDHYWINETSESGSGNAFANFPHCAPATYALDPDSVTLLHYGETPRDRPTTQSAVVRHYDNRTPVPFSTTGSPKSVALNASDHAMAVFKLFSPFNHTLVLATVVFDDETIRVNGVELQEGGSTSVRSVYPVSSNGKRYEITERLVFSHRGPAPIAEEFNEQMCI
jgi:hypothetical protein